MEIFTSTEAWLSLLMLAGMEIVLGIDNIIFISIVTAKLPKEQQKKARNLGLFLALFIRIGLLACIGYLTTLKSDLFTIAGNGFSFRDIIMFGGGLFLVIKSIMEIREKVEEKPDKDEQELKKIKSFKKIVMQVILLDIVFSFDSIITAIALGSHLEVMIAAVIISMFVMIMFAGKISDFINKHPSMKMLALSFLLMIGFLLVLDGLGKGEVISKSYIYFAMGFSFAVELLNIRAHKKSNEKKDHV